MGNQVSIPEMLTNLPNFPSSQFKNGCPDEESRLPNFHKLLLGLQEQ